MAYSESAHIYVHLVMSFTGSLLLTLYIFNPIHHNDVGWNYLSILTLLQWTVEVWECQRCKVEGLECKSNFTQHFTGMRLLNRDVIQVNPYKKKGPWGPFYQHGVTLIPVWTSNHTPNKVWDGITYPFLKPNGNFIPHFIMDMITYPCWNLSQSIMNKILYYIWSYPCCPFILFHKFVYGMVIWWCNHLNFNI